jgi:hypothetical protein
MTYIKNWKEFEEDCEKYSEELVDTYEYLTDEEKDEFQRFTELETIDQKIVNHYRWKNSKIVQTN